MGELSAAERGCDCRIRGEAQREAADHAARDQPGLPQDLDEFAAAESAKNPFFKKVYDSQKAYAAKVVPAKRFMFPPYAFQADYYWPPKEGNSTRGTPNRGRRRRRPSC
ncbi:hypothetical protein ACFIOY_00425 [Bradyrhizobium sp. TZ2]